MTEHDNQVAYFQWCAWMERERPELADAFAIPNGGERNAIVGAKMKAEGAKSGVPDIFLPVPKQPFHGLWIENKFGKNKLSKEQKDWKQRLEKRGYYVAVCYSTVEAVLVTETYLDEPMKLFNASNKVK